MTEEQENFSLSNILSDFPTPEQVLLKQVQTRRKEMDKRNKRIEKRVYESLDLARRCISKAKYDEFTTFKVEEEGKVSDEEKESIAKITSHLFALGFNSTWRVDVQSMVRFRWSIKK